MRRVLLSIEQNRGYGRGLLRGISHYSRLYGPWSFYTGTPFYYRQSKKEQEPLDIVKQWHPDGIIMREDPRMEELMALGIPAIFITYTRIKIPGYVSLLGDHEVSGRLAAEHLLTRGFRNFAYCGVLDKYWSIYRGESFQNRIAESGYDVDVFPFGASETKIDWTSDQEKLKEWLVDLPKPVGIMACTDDRAQNLIEACKACGLHVPGDVAIVGVDNDELLCDLMNPPLSSVALDAFHAGFQAAEALDDLMSGKPRDTDRVIIAQATHVVTRQSSDVFAVEDKDVRAALRFISENSRKAIQVKDVAEECGFTTRIIQKKFKYYLARSVSDVIDRARRELICRQLIESPKTISQIAYELDFISENHFSRYFRRLMKMSPTNYRRRHISHKNKDLMP
jgi:LacI family transcriptional regulator